MAKKLTPSGYQIINIDVNGRTSGVGFTPETDDEKILYEIIQSGKMTKPILLHLYTPNYNIICFPVFDVMTARLSIIFNATDSLVGEYIDIGSNKLVWNEQD